MQGFRQVHEGASLTPLERKRAHLCRERRCDSPLKKGHVALVAPIRNILIYLKIRRKISIMSALSQRKMRCAYVVVHTPLTHTVHTPLLQELEVLVDPP